MLQKAFLEGEEKDSSIILVNGVSGMGKSMLVNHFANKQVLKGAYFAKGKHDLSRNNPPYTTIIQALNQLVEKWIMETEQKKDIIRQTLQREVGGHDQIIRKAIPRLSQILDPVKEIHDTPILNFKDRFNEALLSFINSFGKLEDRIIIFLDDLHWADSATIEFLKLWLSEGKANNLCLIGAFRSDEVNGNNWLLNNQLNTTDNIVTIKLEGLTLEVIRKMTEDILNMRPDRMVEFSEFVFQLTGGNPIYIRESLPFLLEDGVLFYNPQKEKWDYDSSRIKNFDKSSRTLEFIIRKMELLTDDTLELLSIASAIGADFNAALLSSVTEKPPGQIVELLKPAIEKNMIEVLAGWNESPSANQYRFVHDKMQHAAYTLMSEERRNAVHFAVGKSYSSFLGHAAQERHIFDIVNQFNRCLSYFDSKKDRLDLMKMNLQAGKKAKAESSFSLALDYFNIVIQLIEFYREEWESDVVFEVYLEAGEAAYLKSDFVSGVMFYESALKYASTNFQRAKVHHNFLVMYNGVSDMEAAWESGVKALQLLNETFPNQIGKGKVLRQFLKVKWLLRNTELTALLDRPEMDNAEAEQRVLTLMEMIAAGWDKKPETLAYIVLKGFEIIIQNGNTPIGYFAVSGYGAILGMAFGKIKKGWEYIRLGGELTKKYDSMVFHGRGLFGVYGTYSHLIMHSKHNIEPLNRAFVYSKGAGDYSIAAYSSIILLENMVVVGKGLEEVSESASSYFKFLKRTANYDYLSSHKGLVTAARTLIEGYESNVERIEAIQKRMKRVSFHHIKYTWDLYHLLNLVIYRKHHLAKELADEIEVEGYNALSSIELLRVIVMAITRTEEAMQSGNKSKALAYLRFMKRQTDKVLGVNPDNYAQISTLLNALQCELRDRSTKAISYYEEAIGHADKNEFIHFKALFEERLGYLYGKMGKNQLKLACFNAAVASYRTWGALGKVELLEQELSVAELFN